MKIIFVEFQNVGCGGFGTIGLATLLRKLGHEAHVIGTENICSVLGAKDKFVSVLKAEKPDVVGLSVMTPFADHIHEVSLLVKEALGDIPIIVGGYHATIFKERVLSENPYIDHIVIGEAEETLPLLLTKLSNKTAFSIPGIHSRESLSSLPVFGSEEKEQGKVPDSLDHIPFPDEGVIHREYYSESSMFGHPVVPSPSRYVLFSRGCPYQCSYCKIEGDAGFRSKVRFYSPHLVLDHIQFLKERFKLTGLCFLDDNFTLNKEWTYAICDGLISRRINLKWHAQVRANLANPDILRVMKEAGCDAVVITVESGNDRIRNEILCKNVSRENIRNAYRAAKSLGLKTQGTLMLGSPTETYEECLDSINFLREVDPDWAGVVLTTPLPGTKIYQQYKDDIRVTRYSDFDIFAQESHYQRTDVHLAFHKVPPHLLLEALNTIRQEYNFHNRFPDGRNDTGQMSHDLLAREGSSIVVCGKTAAGIDRPFLITSAGTGRELQTVHGKECITPMFSPDGRKVLLSEFDGRRYQLVMVDVRTGRAQQLTFGDMDNYAAVWSPDGSRIAWCRVPQMSLDRANQAEIIVSEWPDFRERRLSCNNRMDAYPVFTSDSGSVIVESGSADGLFGLFRIHWDGKEEPLIYEPECSGNGIPHVYGEYVVFERAVVPDEHLYDLYVMNLSTKEIQRLTTWRTHSNPTPRFSHDGNKIACYRITQERRSELVIHLYPSKDNGYTYREIHHGTSLRLPRWNRNDSLIVVQDESKQSLLVVDLTGNVSEIASPPIRGQRFMEIYSYDIH